MRDDTVKIMYELGINLGSLERYLNPSDTDKNLMKSYEDTVQAI